MNITSPVCDSERKDGCESCKAPSTLSPMKARIPFKIDISSRDDRRRFEEETRDYMKGRCVSLCRGKIDEELAEQYWSFDWLCTRPYATSSKDPETQRIRQQYRTCHEHTPSYTGEDGTTRYIPPERLKKVWYNNTPKANAYLSSLWKSPVAGDYLLYVRYAYDSSREAEERLNTMVKVWRSTVRTKHTYLKMMLRFYRLFTSMIEDDILEDSHYRLLTIEHQGSDFTLATLQYRNNQWRWYLHKDQPLPPYIERAFGVFTETFFRCNQVPSHIASKEKDMYTCFDEMQPLELGFLMGLLHEELQGDMTYRVSAGVSESASRSVDVFKTYSQGEAKSPIY